MAKTIAKAWGINTNRTTKVHRLGHQGSTGEANTFKTFSLTHINSDGSGYFELTRNGKILHKYEWGPE